MKKLILILGLMSTAVLFQNCGTNLSATELNEDGEVQRAVKHAADELLVAPGEVPIYALLAPTEMSVRFNANAWAYNVDLATATATRQGGNVIEKVALSPENYKLFIIALNGAKICEPERTKLNPELACTAIYRLPYATISSRASSFKLGEATSGCTWTQDLCGSRKADLQKAMAALAKESRVTGGVDPRVTVDYGTGVSGDSSVSSD